MLQRIQTVFLLLVILFMTLSMFFPLWLMKGQDGQLIYELFSFKLNSFKTEDGSLQVLYFPFSFVATLAVAAITVALIEVSKFKNRLLQMKLGALNALLMAGTMGLGVYFATQLIVTEVSNGGTYGIGLFLPAAAMICNVIANRFIRKDERLVRSVDRIR